MIDTSKEKQYIGISEDRLHHMLGVARKCYKITKEKGFSEYDAKRLFITGLLHDVGYEFSENSEEHAEISNEMIKMFCGHGDYAVRNHGNPNISSYIYELDILNEANLTIDSKGNECTVEDRLQDIKQRYGVESKEYTDAYKIAKGLNLVHKEQRKEDTILLDDNIETNSHSVNKKIKANMLSDEEMRKIGFTDLCKDRWYFCRMIKFPNTKRYKGFEVSFSITIPKDGSDIRIDVLDEAFCQPYDYQSMIIKNRERNTRVSETCMIVFEQVESLMKYLEDSGVITGHVYGEYI